VSCQGQDREANMRLRGHPIRPDSLDGKAMGEALGEALGETSWISKEGVSPELSSCWSVPFEVRRA
jgi:hypothetical protein